MVVLENAEEWEDDEKQPVPAPGEMLRIPGSIVSFVERLDDELTRSLQHIDPHTVEYIDRLVEEGALYTDIVRAMLYVEHLKNNPKLELSQDILNRVVMRRLEHVYFKVGFVSNVITTYPVADPMPCSLLRWSPSSRTTPGKRYRPR